MNMDESLNTAYNLILEDFSHSNLIIFLKKGTIAERQIAALKLDTVYDNDDTQVLMSNLIGVNGKIRSAVAIKINEIVDGKPDLFLPYYKEFTRALIDIDGNVAREIVEILEKLKKNKTFCKNFTRELEKAIENTFFEYDKLTFKDKKYTVNKVMFKFFWQLEGVLIYHNYFSKDFLSKTLTRCAKAEDYTIREKVAKILSCIKCDEGLLDIKKQLKCDDNYYVRRY